MIEIQNLLTPLPLTVAAVSPWQPIIEFMTTPSLQLFLVLGSVLLATSLALLTMTRLGHARPITKCIVLSLVAHVLLLGYAYGTRMMFAVPVVEESVPVQIEFTDEEARQEQDDVASDEAEQAVKQLSELTIDMAIQPFERPIIEAIEEPEMDVRTESASPSSVLMSDSSELNRILPLVLNDQKTTHRYKDRIEPDNSATPVAQTIEIQRRGERPGDVTKHTPNIEPVANDLVEAELTAPELKPEITQQDVETDFVGQATAPLAVEVDAVEQESMIIDRLVATQKRQRASLPTQPASEPVLDQPRRLGDGLAVPHRYRLRLQRDQVSISRGATKQSEEAVANALQWLASKQEPDGSWSPKTSGAGKEEMVFGHDRGGCGINAETGLTSLAALAFLGAGHNHLEGPYQQTVQKALEFVIEQQRVDGDLSGGAKLYARMYCHSMSLLMLSEALAVTGDARLKRAVESGVKYSIAAQHPTEGGWRYQVGDSGDMSQFGWQVMAISAADSAGVSIDEQTRMRMHHFLKSCQRGEHGGLSSYRPGQGPSTAMTAEALVCRSFLNVPITAEEFAEATDRIISELPEAGNINLYYWYYATMALHRYGGEPWKVWNERIQRVLLSQQTILGSQKGSWSPDGLWAGYGGRIYSTALSTLCLEVYYRYDSGDRSDRLAQRENTVNRK